MQRMGKGRWWEYDGLFVLELPHPYLDYLGSKMKMVSQTPWYMDE